MNFTAVCLGALIMTVSAALTGFTLAAAHRPPHGVWCEVAVVEEHTHREWFLGGHRARDPERALRWLRAQAPYLADRIDPPPHAPWAAPGTLHPHQDNGTGPDAAAVLRHWRHDTAAHRAALRALGERGRHTVSVPDGDGLRYRLSAQLLDADRAMAGNPAPGRRRAEKPGRRAPRRTGPGRGRAAGGGHRGGHRGAAGSSVRERA
ncbi:hypothetical protein CUT44_04870 [Streptomyces carminius]|uniref:Uncharacterized protein n=1 Tax=Streptomyces carminius TaxID=2665496 RepID=A0A2M8M5K4_9ACTN|nr:hypothetical protein [Streptomyces carminius]PJE99474.1 hypothetical protein CUT44_04870 [Streptomyces carminius]